MSWTEMEKKARNHVVLRGDVDDGNTLFRELKAKEKKEGKKQFLHNSKSV